MRETQPHFLPDFIPAHLRHSPLMQKGGFDIFAGLLDDNLYAQMLMEAMSLASTAQQHEVSIPDNEEVRGGIPPRRFLSASGGTIQTAFYRAEWMFDFLQQMAGVSVIPSGQSGTYTYYTRPGDYLALHRDIVTCDLAVITCLHDNANPVGSSGLLCVYPERISEPLSAIRASLSQGAVGLRLMHRQTLVMFGGILPHALLPVAEGQMRIISVLCYRVYGA